MSSFLWFLFWEMLLDAIADFYSEALWVKCEPESVMGSREGRDGLRPAGRD